VIQSISIRAGEHEFVAVCMDSDMGRAMLLTLAAGYISRLRDAVDPREWSQLALETAANVGVAKVVLDTLSDSPAAQERARTKLNGTLLAEGLVDELARDIWEQRREFLEQEGKHPPLTCCDGGCEECHEWALEYKDLLVYQVEEVRDYARGALMALNSKGLLP
jgi:hypothetical protein